MDEDGPQVVGNISAVRVGHYFDMLYSVSCDVNCTALNCKVPNRREYPRDVERIFPEEVPLAY